MARHYVLVDACVAAAHYAPKSTNSVMLRARAKTLLTGSSPMLDAKFLIPNFCIAEVFAVFEKYRWGRTWNKQVKATHTLTPREFDRARTSFGDAIHNGSKLLQLDLNRYHILCSDLVSPINNAYKIKRDRKSKKNVYPASTDDMLIVSMGIWLNQQFSDADFTIVTGDGRLASVLDRAKSVKLGVPMRQHLTTVATRLGLNYGPKIYPNVVDLMRDHKATLRARFPDWTPGW
jgi:hypothetical protein